MMSAAARFSASFPAPVSLSGATPPAQLRAGEPLGVWRLGAALHACESGRWYRAHHSLAPQEAAVLVYQQPQDGMAALLRFAEQATLLAQLDRPALVAPLDSGVTAQGQPYLVLPWLDGQPLLAASAELPLRQRLALAVQLCDSLQSLRAEGLVLRELDPGLLWLLPGQQLRLVCLGLADLAEEAEGPEHFSGAALPFVSPERRAGALPSLGSEAYVLGMLSCWLVNGRPLRSEGHGGLLQSPAAGSGLSAAERISLEALLQKAIAPTSVQRHPSVRELAEDLRAWLAGENHSALSLTPMPPPVPSPVPAAATAGSIFMPAFDGSAAAGSGAASAPAPARKRRKTWRGLAAALLLVAAGLGGWAMYAHGPALQNAAQPAPAGAALASR